MKAGKPQRAKETLQLLQQSAAHSGAADKRTKGGGRGVETGWGGQAVCWQFISELQQMEQQQMLELYRL